MKYADMKKAGTQWVWVTCTDQSHEHVASGYCRWPGIEIKAESYENDQLLFEVVLDLAVTIRNADNVDDWNKLARMVSQHRSGYMNSSYFRKVLSEDLIPKYPAQRKNMPENAITWDMITYIVETGGEAMSDYRSLVEYDFYGANDILFGRIRIQPFGFGDSESHNLFVMNFVKLSTRLAFEKNLATAYSEMGNFVKTFNSQYGPEFVHHIPNEKLKMEVENLTRGITNSAYFYEETKDVILGMVEPIVNVVDNVATVDLASMNVIMGAKGKPLDLSSLKNMKVGTIDEHNQKSIAQLYEDINKDVIAGMNKLLQEELAMAQQNPHAVNHIRNKVNESFALCGYAWQAALIDLDRREAYNEKTMMVCIRCANMKRQADEALKVLQDKMAEDVEGSPEEECLVKSEARKDDAVNHPSHYTVFHDVEVIDIAQHLSFNAGNAIKYICRAGYKSRETEMEDLKKAVKYIDFEMTRLRDVTVIPEAQYDGSKLFRLCEQMPYNRGAAVYHIAEANPDEIQWNLGFARTLIKREISWLEKTNESA